MLYIMIIYLLLRLLYVRKHNIPSPVYCPGRHVQVRPPGAVGSDLQLPTGSQPPLLAQASITTSEMMDGTDVECKVLTRAICSIACVAFTTHTCPIGFFNTTVKIFVHIELQQKSKHLCLTKQIHDKLNHKE